MIFEKNSTLVTRPQNKDLHERACHSSYFKGQSRTVAEVWEVSYKESRNVGLSRNGSSRCDEMSVIKKKINIEKRKRDHKTRLTRKLSEIENATTSTRTSTSDDPM